MENKIEETTFADFDFPNFSRFLFKVTHFFIKKKKPFTNPSPRLVFINEEYGNEYSLVVESLLKNNRKKESCVLQTYKCTLCDKWYKREYFFNKHMEYCESYR